MAATPHAEVVINEPVAPSPSGYIPCKVSACGPKVACLLALHDMRTSSGVCIPCRRHVMRLNPGNPPLLHQHALCYWNMSQLELSNSTSAHDSRLLEAEPCLSSPHCTDVCATDSESVSVMAKKSGSKEPVCKRQEGPVMC